MSVGLGLLNKFLDSGEQVSFFTDHGLEEESFKGSERAVFNMIVEHFKRFKVAPSKETVKAETDVEIGNFPDEPIEYWVEKVEQRVRADLMLKDSQGVLDDISSGDVDAARERVTRMNRAMEARWPSSRVVSLASAASNVVEVHNQIRRSGRMVTGVPFGFSFLDDMSGGGQPGDTIAIVGRPSQGKSYLMLKLALNAWLAGNTVLIVTLEMPVIQCARRVLAMYAMVNATELRLGRLSTWGERKLSRSISRLLGDQTHMFDFMEGSLDSTIEDVAVRIGDLHPDVVYVDGAYLLQTDEHVSGRWERVSTTAEYLKRIANEYMIPVLGSYQFNRRGPGDLGNIGFSDMIGQLASIVISIHDEFDPRSEEEEMVYNPVHYKKLELLKGREGEKGTIRLKFDMNKTLICQDEDERAGS